MKTKLLTALLILIFTPSLVFAARPSINGLNTRVNQLAAENQSQQSEINALRVDVDYLASVSTRLDLCELYNQVAPISGTWPYYCAAPPGSHFMFVTSLSYTPDFGSLTAADRECQARADAAGLSDVYIAWLSAANKDSIRDRITDTAGAYYLVNGVRVADDWMHLSDGQSVGKPNLYAPIDVDESGTQIPPRTVTPWTGTGPGGVSTILDCDGWRSTSVSVAATTGSTEQTETPRWTDEGSLECSSTAPIICVSQRTSNIVSPHYPRGIQP